MLYKGKGDQCECGNQRGISQLSILGKMIVEKVRRVTEGRISEEQCEAMCGREYINQIFRETGGEIF